MKYILTTMVFLCVVLVTAFPKSVLSNSVIIDEAFQRYKSDLPWKEQMTLLGDFAVYLEKNPETIGYILIHSGEKDSYKKIKSRANRAVKFLIQDLKVQKNRIVLTYVGKFEDSEIILQPVDKNSPPPNF